MRWIEVGITQKVLLMVVTPGILIGIVAFFFMRDQDLLLTSLFFIGVIVVLAGTLGVMVSHTILKPLREMTATCDRVTGEPINGLPKTRTDEIGVLSRAIDHLIDFSNEILDTAADGILAVDGGGRIKRLNSAARRIFACKEADAVGRPISDFVLAPGATGLPGYLPAAEHQCATGSSRLTQGLKRTSEENGRRKAGEEFPCSLTVVVQHFARERTYTLTVRDVSREKKARQSLIEARLEAEKALQTMKKFLPEMTHELKAPLGAISMAADIMIRKMGNYSPEYLQKKCELIKRNVEHQMQLVMAILDLSKLEADRVELDIKKDREVKHLVKGALDAAFLDPEHPSDRNGNRLILNCPGDVGVMTTDPELVRRILVNVLTNADKFTENGEIYLTATSDESAVELRVTDTGAGMNDEQIGSLFSEYGRTKVDQENRARHNGTGLGLAITKRMCQLLGGDITGATGGRGKGSTFVITLHRQCPRGTHRPSAVATVTSAGGR